LDETRRRQRNKGLRLWGAAVSWKQEDIR
jgi:hypothetical protein